jgi:hypothetical protein
MMQAKKTLVLGLLALAAVPLSAKDYDSCRDWNRMSSAEHIAYLQGFTNGLVSGAFKAGASKAQGAKAYGVFVVPGVSFGEMHQGVTAICKSSENSLIPIEVALAAFIMQVKGKPQSEIDDFLNNARQVGIQNQDSGKPNK